MKKILPVTVALALSGACTFQVDLEDWLASDDSPVEPEATGDDGVASPLASEVDILFVIDNSGSMAAEQRNVAHAIEALVADLDASGLDWRIGVTTTDDGNAGCPGTTPENAGALKLSSCRERLGDFEFVTESVVLDKAEEGCLEMCELSSIEVLPSTIEGSDDSALRPWIEPANVAPENILPALRCALPQGINGCGFEAPLEAMAKVIARSHTAGDPSFGFLRPKAHLAVVFVTDEEDCSARPGFSSIVTGEAGKTFWSDPFAPFPTSAVCWNAGVACTGGPGTFDHCDPVNKELSGAATPDSDLAVLAPLAQYTDLLDELRAQKQLHGADVHAFAITGVPEDYQSTGVIPYGSGADGAFESDFGVAPGCSSAVGTAVPPVRLREFVKRFSGESEVPRLFSICAANLTSTFHEMATMLLAGD